MILWTNALSIAAPPTITQSTPVTVSWFREKNDPPGSWFLEKQHANTENPPDFTHGASDPLFVNNSTGSSGTVIITFTNAPGPFRLLGFEGDIKATLPPGPSKQPYFTGSSTFMVVTLQGSVPTTVFNSPTTLPSTTSSLSSSISKSISPGPTSISQETPIPPEQQTTSNPTATPTSSEIPPSSSLLPPNASNNGLDEPITKNRHSNVPKIVGSVIGGVIFFSLLAVIFLIWRRRMRRAESTLFHRDLMVRNKGADGFPDLKDSRVFKFDELETGIITEKKSSAVSKQSVSNSSSLADEEERTPVLRRYSSSSSDIDGPPPPSPARTDTYRPSESFDIPAGVRPKLPARTDRQMGIQDQIMALRQQMIRNRSSSSTAEISKLRKRIKELEESQNSDWALELTDVVPPGSGSNTQT
ncbi:hypothetical protein K435DRAFT_840836 [Dendrothele bispora CBS 962.96]|uniref:Uncharacterized protein n=1 Tax=Dendrothele bispora (strain CBS 962.96) TaxID=1314807 RepID=A0A4S8LR12_DENBC|nr:hypothetical protein K435DRAFT_840836 [Dendrothele bispora CBS 962.96]